MGGDEVDFFYTLFVFLTNVTEISQIFAYFKVQVKTVWSFYHVCIFIHFNNAWKFQVKKKFQWGYRKNYKNKHNFLPVFEFFLRFLVITRKLNKMLKNRLKYKVQHLRLHFRTLSWKLYLFYYPTCCSKKNLSKIYSFFAKLKI